MAVVTVVLAQMRDNIDQVHVVLVYLRELGERWEHGDASIAQLQWVVNAYLLALASLILLGG